MEDVFLECAVCKDLTCFSTGTGTCTGTCTGTSTSTISTFLLSFIKRK